MTFYHASPVPGLSVLEPRVSNHGKPLVYLSDCRENTLPYLSNAVEKYCREAGLPPQEFYPKWGSYGFSPAGLLRLEEYWPNAAQETYQGVSGYIYSVEGEDFAPQPDIPHAFLSQRPVRITGREFIPDAYEALLQARQAGKIELRNYEENSPEMLRWIEKSVRQEYDDPQAVPCYRAFLQAKFPFLREAAI